MLSTSMPNGKPCALIVIEENIPLELREKPQWVLWRYVYKPKTKKWTKPPFQPDRSNASTTNSATWYTYDTILNAYNTSNGYFDGIGFVFNSDYTGIDLDHTTDAQLLITDIASYAELSPSGNGVHIITRGAITTAGTGKRDDKRNIEMYDTGRYFTVTGHTLASPISPTNGAVQALYNTLIKAHEKPADEALLKTAITTPLHAQTAAEAAAIPITTKHKIALAMEQVQNLLLKNNGFAKLWRGDTSSYDTPSHGALGLLSDLNRITLLDRELAIQLFKYSTLYQSKPYDYDRTLEKYTQWRASDNVISTLKDVTPQREKKTWLRFDELAQLPKPSFLIEDIVAGEITVLYAPSASGKTFTAIHYAMIAAQEHNVMYVAAEDVNGVAMRAMAWVEYHNDMTGNNFMVWPEELNLMNGEVVSFLDEVTSLHLELIIIDTLALCMIGGDENSTKDMGLFVANVKRIQNATGAAILILHHTDKKGLAERGNSALRAAAYTMLSLSKLNNMITIENVKAKNLTLAPPKVLQLVQLDKDRALIASATKQLDFTIGEDHIRVLAFIHSEGGTVRYTTIKTGLSIPDKALSKILSRLETRGMIAKDEPKAPWKVTTLGLELLSNELSALGSDET